VFQKRTDLAIEAKEIYEESADRQTKLKGVEAREREEGRIKITEVKVLSAEGEKALNKPIGNYITVELPENGLYGEEMSRAAESIKSVLADMLPDGDSAAVLVAGLGNSAITPDAVGSRCARGIVVTRHLTRMMKEQFGQMRPVAAFEPGVLGTTGMESAEIIKAVTEKVSPACVIVIDALASRRLSRVCTTVQICDTGIVPGSGVGNSRAAINKDTLGVPVIAIGVPTVVDAATLTADVLESAGFGEHDREEFALCAGMMVTPRDIDAKLDSLSKLVALSINLALQKDMTPEEAAFLLD